ncbi:hypothetical protein, partial [Streptococcus ruminantium]|uniref:hypothetical protein n=1 Tax=Streptococcus ruminantium TaxID=1917441 RepID=UPI003F7395FC
FLSVIKDCYDNSILAYTLSDYNDNQLVFENLDLVFNENWDATQFVSCILIKVFNIPINSISEN